MDSAHEPKFASWQIKYRLQFEAIRRWKPPAQPDGKRPEMDTLEWCHMWLNKPDPQLTSLTSTGNSGPANVRQRWWTRYLEKMVGGTLSSNPDVLAQANKLVEEQGLTEENLNRERETVTSVTWGMQGSDPANLSVAAAQGDGTNISDIGHRDKRGSRRPWWRLGS